MSKVHNDLVDLIYDRLIKHHDDISKNIIYDSGELDILMVEGRRAIVIEVKSSDSARNRLKAYQQLAHAMLDSPVASHEFYGFYCYWLDRQHIGYGIERLV